MTRAAVSGPVSGGDVLTRACNGRRSGETAAASRETAMSTRSAWVLAALLGVALALRLGLFTGFIGSDDSVYLEAAAELAERGRWTGQDLASSRLGMVAATALGLKLFGLNEFGAVSVSLLASLLTLVLVYALGRIYFDESAALLAAALLAVYPLNVVFSTILVPETLLSCLLAGGLLLHALGERRGGAAGLFLSVGGGVLLGCGYLVKEPAALVVGALGLTWLASLARERRIRTAWIALVAGVALVLLAEALVRYSTSGTPWQRFQISAGAIAHSLATSEHERQQSSSYLYLRSMFVSFYEVGLLFYLLVGATALAWWRGFRPPAVLVTWLVVMVGYLSLGSASLTMYAPLPKQPRYLEAATVPAVVLTAGALAYLLGAAGRWPRRLAWVSVAAYAVLGLLCAQVTSGLERWRFEPVRETYRWLGDNGLTAAHATPRVANGLHQLSGLTWPIKQSRSQVCGENRRGVLAVWSVRAGAAAPRPEGDCHFWTLLHQMEVTPPASVSLGLSTLRAVLAHVPLPSSLTAKILHTIQQHQATVVVRIFGAAGEPPPGGPARVRAGG